MYASSYNTLPALDAADANFFIDRLLYSPSQLLLAIDAINNCGIIRAKKEIQSLIEIGDKKVRPIFAHFENNESRNFLILLSKFDFLSFELIEKIYGDQINEIMDITSEGMVYGIIETFGPSEVYVKLDYSISDYIRRNRLQMDTDLQLHVKEVLEEEINHAELIRDSLQPRMMSGEYVFNC